VKFNNDDLSLKLKVFVTTPDIANIGKYIPNVTSERVRKLALNVTQN